MVGLRPANAENVGAIFIRRYRDLRDVEEIEGLPLQRVLARQLLSFRLDYSTDVRAMLGYSDHVASISHDGRRMVPSRCV